jgi:hypothetical protein
MEPQMEPQICSWVSTGNPLSKLDNLPQPPQSQHSPNLATNGHDGESGDQR